MAKTIKLVTTSPAPAPAPTPKLLGERIYSMAKETKGTWLYDWSNAPAGTPDWAKKWYILKSDFPVCPGPQITVAMTVK